MVISHDPPDYPILNLEVARRGRETHKDCPDDCEAKTYFTAQVLKLERSVEVTQPLRSTWNIWSQ